MKKLVLSFGLGVAFAFGAAAQDVDYTSSIINNSFEYASDGTLLDGDNDGKVDNAHIDKGRTDDTGYRVRNSVEKEFWKWNVSNWDFMAGNNPPSQGMNRDISPIEKIHGTFAMWLGGNNQFKVAGENTSEFEFYQIIKDLPAGTYMVQCRLAVANNKRTSQRLFANSSVQYHGTASQYVSNQTAGETATFAGWPDGEKNLQEMKVYVTIVEDEDLKIGIRTGNIKGDGSFAANANPLWGWFKADYFRLTKLDPANVADATLKSLTVSEGMLSPAFNPATTTYSCVLPAGTQTVTPFAAVNFAAATLSGAEAVDVSSGSGISTIEVTALDGITTETYTINYSYAANATANLTSLITNNSFEYAWEGQLAGVDGCNTTANGWINGNTWRPKHTDNKSGHDEFYGWTVTDWSMRNTGSTAQSLEKDGNPKDGSFDIAIFGNQVFSDPTSWELYQTIDKDALSAGTYKVQARLAVDNAKRTSQRLFANNSVQYHADEATHTLNLTDGETAAYAGYPGVSNVLNEMKVYVTIGEEEDLKIGIRTGSKKTDETIAAAADPIWGSFKADYFRLIKLDPADAVNADLADIMLSAGTLVAASQSLGSLRSTLSFAPATTTYDVELPEETTSVTAVATAALEDVKITGDGTVDVSGGSAQQVIVVTALDGTTKKTYTINYSVKSATGINVVATGKVEKSVSYSTLTGIAAPSTAKGLLLKKTTYTDGSVKVEKVVK